MDAGRRLLGNRILGMGLALLLCFSMIPAGGAYAKEYEEGAFDGVPSYVTDIGVPTTCEELDWDALEAGVDYEEQCMLIVFMPKTSLEEAEAYIANQGWKEGSGGPIAWFEEDGIKCLDAYVPEGQSLRDAMHEAESSRLVWYVELNRYSYASADGGIGGEPDSSFDEADAPAEPSDLDSASVDSNSGSTIVTKTDPWHFGKIGILDAWKYSQRDDSVCVAVFDSGVSRACASLSGSLDLGHYCDAVVYPDDARDLISTRGTKVANIIAGKATGHVEMNIGISPGAKILSVNIVTDVVDGKVIIDGRSVARGLDYLLMVNHNLKNKVRVVDIGYALPAKVGDFLQTLISKATNQGISIVCCAGDDNTEESMN